MNTATSNTAAPGRGSAVGAPSLPLHLVELARDLGVELPADPCRAVREVLLAARYFDFRDFRTRAIVATLNRTLGVEPPSIELRRARHALGGGWGMPRVRPDDAAWSASAEELRRPRSPFTPRCEPYPREWFAALAATAAALGAPLPAWPGATSAPFDHAAMVEWAACVEAVRARVVAGVDAALDELEAAEPAGVLAWWAHLLRELLVVGPVDDRGDAATALRVLRLSGVAVSLAPAPSLRIAAVTNESAAPRGG